MAPHLPEAAPRHHPGPWAPWEFCCVRDPELHLFVFQIGGDKQAWLLDLGPGSPRCVYLLPASLRMKERMLAALGALAQ